MVKLEKTRARHHLANHPMRGTVHISGEHCSNVPLFHPADRFKQVSREELLSHFVFFPRSFSLQQCGSKASLLRRVHLCGGGFHPQRRSDVHLCRGWASCFPGVLFCPRMTPRARRRVVPSSICHLVGPRPHPLPTVGGGSSLAHHKYMHDSDAEAMKCCCGDSKKPCLSFPSPRLCLCLRTTAWFCPL